MPNGTCASCFHTPRPADREAVSELNPRPPRDVLLTATQHDIVTRLLDGEKAPAIARARKRSVDTVRQTVRAIYSRFGVRNAEELAAGFASAFFNVRVDDVNGREHNLRSGITAVDRALKTMQRENNRKGTNRRRTSVRLHEDEMTAILTACAETAELD
jgi:DNA-binding CsgD family transcriptional regulator